MATPSGKQEFFGQHIETHLDRLYGAALRFTRNRSDAEDLVADTVTRAWTGIETLQDTERFLPWMLRIMANTFISEQRRAVSRMPHEQYTECTDDGDTPFSLFDRLHQPFLLWWGNPEQQFLDQLLREDIQRALDSIPENFGLVVVLSDVDGLTYQEIAEALDIPVGTVRSRLARGRGLLQKCLWQHAEGRGLVQDSEKG